MENNIVLFLVSEAIVTLTAIVGVYMNIQLKLKELDLRVKNIEVQDSVIINSLNAIKNQIVDLRVAMENKLDRK